MIQDVPMMQKNTPYIYIYIHTYIYIYKYGPAFQPPSPRPWSWVSHSTVPLPPVVVWWGVCGAGCVGGGCNVCMTIYIYIWHGVYGEYGM